MDNELRKAIRGYLEDKVGISKSLDSTMTEAVARSHLNDDQNFGTTVLSYITLLSQEEADRRAQRTQTWLIVVTTLLVVATASLAYATFVHR